MLQDLLDVDSLVEHIYLNNGYINNTKVKNVYLSVDEFVYDICDTIEA